MSIRDHVLVIILLVLSSELGLSIQAEPGERIRSNVVASVDDAQTLIIRIAIVDADTWEPVEGANLRLCGNLPDKGEEDRPSGGGPQPGGIQSESVPTATTNAEGVAIFAFHRFQVDRCYGLSRSVRPADRRDFYICPIDVAKRIEGVGILHPDYRFREIPIHCEGVLVRRSQRSGPSRWYSPIWEHDEDWATTTVRGLYVSEGSLHFSVFCLEPPKQMEFFERVRRLSDGTWLDRFFRDLGGTSGETRTPSNMWIVYLCDDIAIERLRNPPEVPTISSDIEILTPSLSTDCRCMPIAVRRDGRVNTASAHPLSPSTTPENSGSAPTARVPTVEGTNAPQQLASADRLGISIVKLTAVRRLDSGIFRSHWHKPSLMVV